MCEILNDTTSANLRELLQFNNDGSNSLQMEKQIRNPSSTGPKLKR